MAVKTHITRVKCPVCGGNKVARYLPIPCWVCEGTGKATYQKLEMFSGVTESLGGGGYLAGDHSLEDFKHFRKRAEAILQLSHELARGILKEETWLKARALCEQAYADG